MKRTTTLAAVSLAMAISFAPGPAQALTTVTVPVDCAFQSLSTLLSSVSGRPPVAVVLTIKGTCTEDITIEFDDLTLEGDPIDGGTISGTITINGAQRVVIDNLTVTGPGVGIIGTNAAAFTVKNSNVINNEESGIFVIRSSSALLINNAISGNGTRSVDPFIFFDVGLFLGNAASVQSNGNTYEDNQYAAIESDRQSAFRNATFLPREPGHPPIAAQKDVIIRKGGDPANPATCTTNGNGPIAATAFNMGLVEFRNADICGDIEGFNNSTIRIDDAGGEIIGTVSVGNGSFVRIKDRSSFGDGRLTTFEGTLNCSNFSGTFGSDVQCGQTCSGAIPGTCSP